MRGLLFTSVLSFLSTGMRLLSTLLVSAACGAIFSARAADAAFAYNGTVAGPCTISASYAGAKGPGFCPGKGSQPYICQEDAIIMPNGAAHAGNGTEQNPTLVPLKISFPPNSQCMAETTLVNASVFMKEGVLQAAVTIEEMSNAFSAGDRIFGTGASRAVMGVHRPSSLGNDSLCEFTYTVNTGACFLSDVPIPTPTPEPKPSSSHTLAQPVLAASFALIVSAAHLLMQ